VLTETEIAQLKGQREFWYNAAVSARADLAEAREAIRERRDRAGAAADDLHLRGLHEAAHQHAFLHDELAAVLSPLEETR
jgi:hypothetical protein